MKKEEIIKVAPRRPDTTLGDDRWIMDWYEGEHWLEVGWREDSGLWFFHHHGYNGYGYRFRTVQQIREILNDVVKAN